ncbi:anthranilate synthase component II [Aridibaculum aurantiacum]|uniref:anthranilate synthase component II n=1 Tax=Aridibaculum aurantiacum TaxID=2810307 RepID=UPI001A96895A|nr:aminodeoxychorismate/anthranilate synthase component II [Aridibaculum aurantiacum]
MKILIIDNYDSFTYNLVHLVEKITNTKVDVYRNDQVTLEKIGEYDKIILSPGPGIPSEAGLLLDVIRKYAATKSILGVCLGHQAIGEVFGGKLVNLDTVYHGIATPVRLTPSVAGEHPLFKGLPKTFEVGRYHSWIVANEDFPEQLEITAVDDNNLVMAMQHKEFDVQGVQFHPESILTPDGEKILKNWLEK